MKEHQFYFSSTQKRSIQLCYISFISFLQSFCHSNVEGCLIAFVICRRCVLIHLSPSCASVIFIKFVASALNRLEILRMFTLLTTQTFNIYKIYFELD